MIFNFLYKFKDSFVSFFTKNLSTKIIAFFITLVLWVIVVGSKNVEILKSVKLEYITSNELMISNNVPENVEVRFLGPRSKLRDLFEDDYNITVDLRNKRVGYVTYRLQNELINLPIGIKILDVFPQTIKVKLDAVVKKSVDVKIAYNNNLPKGYKIKEMTITPQKVQISGAKGDLSKIDSIYTKNIDLSKLEAPQNFEVKIDKSKLQNIKYISNEIFSVYINVVPVVEVRKFEDIKVRINAAERFKINPETVDVYVEGPKLLVDKILKEEIDVSLDISLNAKGSYKENVNVSLPNDEVFLKSVIPKKISVWIY